MRMQNGYVVMVNPRGDTSAKIYPSGRLVTTAGGDI